MTVKLINGLVTSWKLGFVFDLRLRDLQLLVLLAFAHCT